MSRNTSQSSKYFSKPYLELRKIIGYLAMLLPVIVVLGAWLMPPHTSLQSSISSYYHTGSRNFFFGILFATGIFLLTYNPGAYDTAYRESSDRKFGIAAGIFAVFVALFPTARSDWETIQPPAFYDEGLYDLLHLFFTALLFASLIYFSGVLFRKTAPGKVIDPRSKKALRNRIYYGCAVVMTVCVGLIVVLFLLPDSMAEALEPYRPVFFLEFIALLAFGLSWFVKGEALKFLMD